MCSICPESNLDAYGSRNRDRFIVLESAADPGCHRLSYKAWDIFPLFGIRNTARQIHDFNAVTALVVWRYHQTVGQVEDICLERV